MDEHDDDLESEVVEGAEKETAGFPTTSDELERESDMPEDDDGTDILDNDAAEL